MESFNIFLILFLALYCRHCFKKLDKYKLENDSFKEKYISNFDDFQELDKNIIKLARTNEQFYMYFQYLFDEGLFDDFKKYQKELEKKKKLEENRKII